MTPTDLDLKKVSNSDLISRLEKLVRTERKITHFILAHILEIESRRLYAEMGFDGMYTYLTRGLGYSEAAAYRRLQAARLLKAVPEVSKKLEDGSLNLSQLAQVQKSLKDSVPRLDKKSGTKPLAEKARDVLQKLENKNSFESEKLIAFEFDQPIRKQEILKPQQDDSVRLEITFTVEQFAELQAARSSLSHVCPDGGWAEVIAILASRNNKKLASKTPQQMTPSVRATKLPTPDAPDSSASKLVRPGKRKYISVHTKRLLLSKSEHCCEYVDSKSGKRCSSRYQLQLDHRRPLAKGGDNSVENLRILCRTHNLLMAKRWGLVLPSHKPSFADQTHKPR